MYERREKERDRETKREENRVGREENRRTRPNKVACSKVDHCAPFSAPFSPPFVFSHLLAGLISEPNGLARDLWKASFLEQVSVFVFVLYLLFFLSFSVFCFMHFVVLVWSGTIFIFCFYFFSVIPVHCSLATISRWIFQESWLPTSEGPRWHPDWVPEGARWYVAICPSPAFFSLICFLCFFFVCWFVSFSNLQPRKTRTTTLLSHLRTLASCWSGSDLWRRAMVFWRESRINSEWSMLRTKSTCSLLLCLSLSISKNVDHHRSSIV